MPNGAFISGLMRGLPRLLADELAEDAMAGAVPSVSKQLAGAFAQPILEGAGHRTAQMLGLEPKPKDEDD
jgi:hypothetical protein